jgi:hypothetical protein
MALFAFFLDSAANLHWSALLAVPLLIIGNLLHNRYHKTLYRIPGPWIRSMSTIPRVWSVWKGQSQQDDLELHRKYGKMVRVAPNIISVSDVNEMNQLYGITTKFYKSEFYSLQEVYDESGALMPDPFILKDKALHSRMKRNAANAYSLNGLIQMEPYVDEVVNTLIAKLNTFLGNSENIDLGQILKDFSMDAVFNLTFGKTFDILERGDWAGLYKPLHVGTVYMAVVRSVHACARFC